MTGIRLSADEIKYITLMESITGARIRDCVVEDGLIGVLVEAGDMGLAIGRGGGNAERARKALGMSVWFVESADDERAFIRNMFTPVKLKGIRFSGERGGRKAVVGVSKYDKSKVIGRGGRKINLARKLARRHHNIQDIKIRVTN